MSPDDNSTENLPAARMNRPMMIKGLSPNLPERGKIKIGEKGQMRRSAQGNEFQPPKKLDHFLVTTVERGEDGNFKHDAAIHALLGDKPTEIPVRLLYDDPALNFPTRYACYTGRTLWCSGDGETAQRLETDNKTYKQCVCPCPRKDPAYTGKDKCKMNGSLSTIIEGGGGIGGVWKFRTTSYNSIVGLLSSMAFLRSVTGGPLANIPLKLAVRPKQATTPDGQQQTIYVVSLEYAGDIASLQDTGHRIALERAKAHVSIRHIEDEARRLLLAPPDAPLPGDVSEDVVDEFYPEQVTGAAIPPGDAPPRPTRAGGATVEATTIEGTATESVTAEPTTQPANDAAVSDPAPTDQDAVLELLLEELAVVQEQKDIDEIQFFRVEEIANLSGTIKQRWDKAVADKTALFKTKKRK